ncbi:receptor-like protein EIX2 [Ricinus communis]|nr:receptor-like protein EIX2 [Ricinus communis]
MELIELAKLGTLNLSINNLSGSIPLEIGKLGWLETFDLSRNKFSGLIPPSMAQLTFLNHLNLSYNNLSGKIPIANQFQSLNDPSIYVGNTALCGMPLPTKCYEENEYSPFPDDENDGEDEDNLKKRWFFVTIGLGFLVGFWGVCGSLIIKTSWRVVYFRFIDEKKDAILTIF